MSHKKCCVINCKNTGRNSTYQFYKFPVGAWRLEQRNKWIAAIMRKNPDGSPWYPKTDSTICSAHFVGGKKSDSEASPSYVPSIFPPKLSQASKLIRFVNLINTDQNCISKDQCEEVENENKHNMIVQNGCLAGTSNQLKLKQANNNCNSEVPETFLTTEVKGEPSDDELDNCSTEDSLQECEVKIEQASHANDEKIQKDPLSFEVKTESRDDEVETTKVQTDQISVVVKDESPDDEAETTQVQPDPITYELKTESRDDEEETTQVQPDPITYELKTESRDDEEETTQVQSDPITSEVKTEPRDDEEDMTQVQPDPITSEVTDPITSEVETEPRDDEEETTIPEKGLSVSRTKAKKQLKQRQINASPTNGWIIGRKRGVQSVLMVPQKTPPRKRKVRILCINCGVNAFRMRRHSLLTETEEVLQRIRHQNPGITDIPSDSVICHACWLLLHQSIETPESSTDIVGHTNVCVDCGRSLYKTTRFHILSSNTEREEGIRDTVAEKISSRSPRTSNRVCHSCWLKLKRKRTLGEKPSDPSTSVVPASEQHSVVPGTLSGQIGPVEEECPEKEPTIVLSDYGRAPFTQAHCLFPGCHHQERLVVPLSLRKRLFTDFKFYVPENCRICNYHLKNDLWHKLKESEMSHTFTEAHICDFVTLLKQES